MKKQLVDRRSLVKMAALGSVATGAVAASIGKAVADTHPNKPNFLGSVYFDEQNPGRWAGKEKSHTPVIEVKKTSGGHAVTVITGHEMKGFEHYIVKHLLIDKNFNVMGEKLFNPIQELQAKSKFELTGEPYQGTLYAVSVCNLHDAWVQSIEVT